MSTAAGSRLDKLLRLLEAEPNDPFVLYGIAQELAKLDPPTGGHGRALEYYDRCIAADRHYNYAYFHKAVSLQALGRTDEARSTLEAGIAAARESRDEKALSEMSGMLAGL